MRKNLILFFIFFTPIFLINTSQGDLSISQEYDNSYKNLAISIKAENDISESSLPNDFYHLSSFDKQNLDQNVPNYSIISSYVPMFFKTQEIINQAYPEKETQIFLQSDPCITPSLGDWVLTSSCTLFSSADITGQVIIENNSTLAIPSGAILGIDFFNYNLIVKSGSTVLINSGGAIKHNSLGSDSFGIKYLYPTKSGGNTWFMNMLNVTMDPRFDPNGEIVKNGDGSWKMQNNSEARLAIFSTNKETYENTLILNYSRTVLATNGYMQLPSDWKNFEMTGYVKLNEGDDDDFTWYGRGGKHQGVDSGCEGSSYKASLNFDGGTRFAKESWHVHYDFTDKKNSTAPILNNWIGFKYVLYNKPGINFAEQVNGEIWLDSQNNNNWVKVDSFVDDGWGSGAERCGPALADNMPISWGGPIATFRVDHANDFDFKYLSIREINPP